MRCKVWNCDKIATYEALKLNNRPYKQPFGYCARHKNVLPNLRKIDNFRKLVHIWIEKNWGKRCPDYEKECPLCKAWDCFDYLFQEEKKNG